jgi:FtsZ-binding cell division protein ZapB
MANPNSVIEKLGEQIKNLTITIAILQTELEEARQAKPNQDSKSGGKPE